MLRDASGGAAQVLLISTGSEVELIIKAQAALAALGVRARVVSMPSTNVFDRQDAAYRAEVLPHGVPRVAIEAGVPDFWYKYVGLDGAVLGISTFGESAPASELYKHFGLTVEHIVAAARVLAA